MRQSCLPDASFLHESKFGARDLGRDEHSMKTRKLGDLAFGLVAVLAAAVPSIARPTRADAFVDPVVTPVSAYAIDVPSSLLAAATEGVSANGIGSGQLGAILANSARFDSDWVLTAVGRTMGGSTTTTPPDITDLSAAERAQFDALVSTFDGAPATKLAGFTKVVGGKAIPIVGAVLTGVQLGAGVDRAVGVDVDGGLCAGGPNFGFQATDAVLAALTSTDCDAWNLSQQQQAARNQDTMPTVTATAVGSTSCLGAFCASITSMTYVAPSSYAYCIVWNVPSPGTNVVPLGQFLNLGQTWFGGWDYKSTSLTSGGSTFCPAPPAGSFASVMAMRINNTWADPLTAWKVTQSSSATVATVTPPTLTYPDPARTIRCDITLSTGQVLSASTPTFHEGDANIPRPVYPAIPPGAVPSNTKCVETGGPQPLTLSQGATTTQYQSWRTNDKECGNGSCLLDLRQNGASCFFSAIDCDGWMTDPNRDTDYQCFIGTHAAAISECYVYGTTFNAAARASGHAYADPSTGAAVDGPTALSDADQVESALLTRRWVETGDYPVVDDSSKPNLAAAIAAACVAQLEPEPDILIIKTCSETAIYSPGVDITEATAHDISAIGAGQPSLLHYESRSQKQIGGLSPGWYGTPQTNCSGTYRSSTDDFPTNCDEFPFYSTVEGGPGASLVNILGTDNDTQGRQLGQFYQACGLVGSPVASDSNAFVVVPNPGSPSVGICGLG